MSQQISAEIVSYINHTVHHIRVKLVYKMPQG